MGNLSTGSTMIPRDDEKYTMSRPDDDKFTSVMVWEDVMKDFGSKISADSVLDNSKCIPEI